MLHASCVSLSGRGVLITGASGSGKSGLALQLMAFGAQLVSDDQTLLTVRDEKLIAVCPETIRGQVEARGIGILNAQAVESTQVVLSIDLNRRETDRLPQPHEMRLLGQNVPLYYKVNAPHFAAGIMQFLRLGRGA
nr:HPr kinase/phosphatase C-terminal domain-containing protein [Shimia abyssi]